MAASGSGLTQSDLERIQQNRQRALEKLSRKRKQDSCQPPPLPKRPPSMPEKPSQEKFNSFFKPKKPEPKKITVVFSIVTASRFKADVAYDKSLIDLFKTIQSRQYDSENRIWTFGLEHYVSLVRKIRSNSSLSHVTINEIPNTVLSLFLKKLSKISHPTDINDRVPRDLYTSLMQFQKEGLEYCIMRNGRALIADDMGLGKTIQAISVACYYRSEWPLLVVCPASVKIYWAESFSRWVPGVSSDDVNVVLTTSGKLDKSLINICSYDCAVKLFNKKRGLFHVVICDESHFLKNYKTARCKAIIPIVKKAQRAIFLSGTPALSRPIELYTQIVAIDTSFRMKLTDFGVRYCNGTKNKFGWDFSGASNLHELQLYMEQSIMIRRMKKDVLDQLPSKRRQMVVLNPSVIKIPKRNNDAFKELMQNARKSKDKEIDKEKDKFLPLFSKSAEMKQDAVCQYILDMLEGKRKIVVFAHHKIMLDRICEMLGNYKYKFIRIDGSTLAQQRSKYCDEFQHDDSVLVAVLSITAANTGITLTASSTVVFGELFWNPGVLVQAEDRVYRIGQQDSVNIHYLVAKETIDDYFWPLINRKLEVLNTVGLASVNFEGTDMTVTEPPLVPLPPPNSSDDVIDVVDLEISKDNDEQWFSTLEDDDVIFLDDV